MTTAAALSCSISLLRNKIREDKTGMWMWMLWEISTQCFNTWMMIMMMMMQTTRGNSCR